MQSRLRRSRTLLIALGLGLGYLARIVLGPPASETDDQNRFLKPLPEVDDVDLLDQELDLQIRSGENAYRDNRQGLVPPIKIAGSLPFPDFGLFSLHQAPVSPGTALTGFSPREFEHDSRAVFEPHGNQVCASGCALNRHPTGKLSAAHFHELMAQYALEPAAAPSPSLEELLFYGPQTRQLIEADGMAPLKADQAVFLWDELKRTHAKISLRVIDSNGEVRTWLPPTRVPLDRRHVFEMETKNLQPLVTSGTVKRVGLDHLWVRL
jgi:hypothetical protein